MSEDPYLQEFLIQKCPQGNLWEAFLVTRQGGRYRVPRYAWTRRGIIRVARRERDRENRAARNHRGSRERVT